MGKVKDTQLFTLLKNFLVIYLPNQRKASVNTVKSYRTAWNQLLEFIANRKGISTMSVTMDMINYSSVTDYLDWICSDRKASPATRNNRLAAIRSFISYASACKPEYISLYSELEAIKIQKADNFAKVDYMSEDAVKALFQAPDVSSRLGIRDRFLMIFLYDTGARIQETLNVRICDIKIDKCPTVTLHGKGGKTRIVPLMSETIEHMKAYMEIFHKGETRFSQEWLFYVERKGVKNAMSDDIVRINMQRYADIARKSCPEVPANVHPHLWRHTRAMHLYQHGMDLTLISQWLGHTQLETTLIYAYADTETKRKAIERAMGKEPHSDIDSSYSIDDEELLKRLYGLK